MIRPFGRRAGRRRALLREVEEAEGRGEKVKVFGPAEKCPGCDLRLAPDDLRTQVAHMEKEHPEIVAERLEEAGFEQQPDGSWVDNLVWP